MFFIGVQPILGRYTARNAMKCGHIQDAVCVRCTGSNTELDGGGARRYRLFISLLPQTLNIISWTRTLKNGIRFFSICNSYNVSMLVVWEILNVSPRAQPEGERSIFPIQPA